MCVCVCGGGAGVKIDTTRRRHAKVTEFASSCHKNLNMQCRKILLDLFIQNFSNQEKCDASS